MRKLFGFFVVLMGVLVFVAIPWAADWNFSGSARVATFWVDDDYSDVPQTLGNGQTIDDDQDLQWDFTPESRIETKVEAERVKGHIELALKGDGAGDLGVGTRIASGTWKFAEDARLTVGKDYTPLAQFISGQVFDGDLGLLGYGTTYGNRVGQIAVGFGGFEIAFITPNSGDISDANGVSTGGDVDEYFPKVEAKFEMTMDAFNWAIRGGFQTYTISEVVPIGGTGTNDIDVTSWTVTADAGLNIGPAYVKGAVSYGQNVGNANWDLPGNTYGHGDSQFVTGNATWDGDDGTDDTDTWMACLVAGFKVSDALTLEAGGGWRNDNPDFEGADDTNVWVTYGQAVISLAPGVWIIPEAGYYDFGDDDFGDDAGSRWYAGAKWQIDF
jgi:hypothetical protein